MVNGNNGCHPPTVNGNGCHRRKEEVEVIHLTPWDLRLISIDYIHKGILLPKPPAEGDNNDFFNALESSFARALRLFYPFAGRLASEERGDGTVSVFLRCTGEGAEFVHAVAPEVAVVDIVSSLYTPPVVWDFYPLALVLGADAAIERLPVLAVQVTVLDFYKLDLCSCAPYVQFVAPPLNAKENMLSVLDFTVTRQLSSSRTFL
jgi:hypothetical protein